MHRNLLVLALPILVAPWTGCAHRGRVTLETFAVAPANGGVRADDRPTIAIGGEATLTFFQADRLGDGAVFRTEARFDTVRSLDPDRVEVVTVDRGRRPTRVTVRPFRPGIARLALERGSERRIVELRVARARRASIVHAMESLAPDVPLAFLAGATVRFEVRALDERGSPVRGRGLLDEDAVSIEGPASLVAVDDIHVELRLEAPGRVVIEAASGTARTRRAFDVVSPEDVASVEVAVRSYEFGSGCLATPFATMRAQRPSRRFGERPVLLALRARLPDGRFAVGIEGVADVRTESPATCTVRPAARPETVHAVLRFFAPESAGFQTRAFDLVGREPGACRITASVGGAHTRARVVVP